MLSYDEKLHSKIFCNYVSKIDVLFSGQKWLGNLSAKNASVYRISGLNVTKIGDFVDGQRIDTDVNEEKN